MLVALDRLTGGPGFTGDDQRLLEAFAASAATAVATAQSVARSPCGAAIEAAEDERRRWARELHDETLQSLAAVQMILTAGKRSDRAGGGVGRSTTPCAIELRQRSPTSAR